MKMCFWWLHDADRGCRGLSSFSWGHYQHLPASARQMAEGFEKRLRDCGGAALEALKTDLEWAWLCAQVHPQTPKHPKTIWFHLVPNSPYFIIFPHDFEHVWRCLKISHSEDIWGPLDSAFWCWRWQMWQAAAVLLLARDGSKAQEAVQLMAASKAADPAEKTSMIFPLFASIYIYDFISL